VLAVLLIAVGLWFVRKRQQPDDAEQSSTATATAGSTADVETDQMMAQYSAEHPLQAQEAPEPLTEEKPLSTDEALDLLLAEADLGIAEVPAEAVAAAQPEIEAPVMEALADDALELSDDLMPTVELEDWSVDTLATEAAPAVDKEFVFEPELFVDEVVAAPEVAEVPAAAQPEPVVDDAFHDATDRDFVVTKLELARQYLEMSDAESARDLLQEVLEEGDEELKQAATDLLKKIS
jgi:pilus assembly protein FimV